MTTYGEIVIKSHVIRETIFANESERRLDDPQRCFNYWQNHIATSPSFDPEKEHLIAVILDSKLNVKGHVIVSMGLINQCLAHAREVYRAAIHLAGAHVVLMHNHPSNDPKPSSDDIRATRDLIAAGKVIGIPLIDHVVIGKQSEQCKGFVSLREIGIF